LDAAGLSLLNFDQLSMIETKRLKLRIWRLNDAEALFKYASDRRVSEPAHWPCHTSIGMSRKVIEEFFIPNPYNFAVVLKETEEPVGCIGLVPVGEEHHLLLPGEREVGYWIGYPYWGNGLTTEVLEGFIGYCRNVSGIKSLLITTDGSNAPSQRVAEKCGFQYLENYTFEGISSKAYRLTLDAPASMYASLPVESPTNIETLSLD